MNALWNTLEFPFEYFKQIKLNKNITENFREQIELIEKGESTYNYRTMINTMKNKDLSILLDIILYGKDKKENAETTITEEYFSFLMNERTSFNDFKSPLWLVLSLKQKVLMWAYQYHPLEFKIMTLLLFQEIMFHIKKIKQIDKEIEGTVTNFVITLIISFISSNSHLGI